MRLGGLARAFAKETRGNVAIIVGFLFVPLAVIAGGATDIARFESFRAQLQDGVDRGVLAATSLGQTKTVEDTVVNYLKSVSFNDEITVTVLQDVKSMTAKTVTVRANYVMATAFLPLIGIDTMTVVAQASAEERRQNVEISLMLDFSGSMVGSRFARLKPAARDFVSTLLTDATKAYTTISIVPYAGQVSPGAAMFNALGGTRVHNNSSCFMLKSPDYAAGQINFSGRAQVDNFTVWNATNYSTDLNPAWCPGEDTAISFLSNDAAYLKAQIDGYKMYDGTGTAVAMNWGLMLLDPSARPLIAKAVALGKTQPQFANRPADYTDPNTIKFVVLMTDGNITEQYVAIDPTKPVRTASNSKIYRDPITNKDQNTTETAALLAKVCSSAKANRVIVFTIGFDIGSNSAAMTQMRDCASSPSHFYSVTGLDISSAFRSIATAIQKIKLTQ